MKILLVDDIRDVLTYMSKSILEQHNDWIIDCSDTYEQALSMAQNNTYDLFILDYELDINNPEKNGFKLGLELKTYDKYVYTPVIFETSYPEHIYDTVNKLNCIYYLIKPYTNEQLIEMVDKIANIPSRTPHERKQITLHDAFGINFLVYAEDIVYAESNRHQITIVTLTETFVCTGITLTTFEEYYKSKFFRCHKSFVINVDYITSFNKLYSCFTLTTPSTNTKYNIPIGRKYLDLSAERMRYKK